MNRKELFSLLGGAGLGLFIAWQLHRLGFAPSYWKTAFGLGCTGYILTASGLGSILEGFFPPLGDGGSDGGDFFDCDGGDGGDCD